MASNSTNRTEQVGGVTLDYTWYPGEDLYCDGTVEDEILDIVKNHAPSEFETIIREKKEWPVLYHLSRDRGNIVDWIPFTGKEKVLEIGAGPGAITGVLADKCASVTCVELSKKRSLINAYRHQDRDNITILVGNFEDIEPHLDTDYDYVFLIGVFEYAQSYIHRAIEKPDAAGSAARPQQVSAAGEDPSMTAGAAGDPPASEGASSHNSTADPYHAELNLIAGHCRPETGRIVIAIENRLGLKYFAGCREDHSGVFFDGIESYQNGPHPATTFSRRGLEKIFSDCGQQQYTFYYPYPDYKFMETLYSDRRLPDGTELSDNIRNFDRDRLLLFDETKAYKGITEDGLFPVFSNSYEIVLGPELPVTYCKFSSERAPQYRIRTEVYDRSLEDGTGSDGRVPDAGRGGSEAYCDETRQIRKYPLDAAAAAHVQRMMASCEQLRHRYEPETGADADGLAVDVSGTGAAAAADLHRTADAAQNGKACPSLRIATCHAAAGGGVAFDFIHGRTLESLLDARIADGDREGFLELLSAYRERVGRNPEEKIADYDMTFANIIVNGDVWTAIDYEWAVDRAIPVQELLFRSMVCYYREDERRREKVENLIPREELLHFLGVSNEEAERLSREEDAFQEKVTGGTVALGQLRAMMNTKVIKPVELQTEEEKEAGLRATREQNRLEELRQQKEDYERHKQLVGVRLYFDTGKGYNEDEIHDVGELYREESILTFTVEVARNVHHLRVDPASVPCLVMLRRIVIDGLESSEKVFRKLRRHNGTDAAGGAVLYATSDPWMDWDMDKVRRKCGIRDNDGRTSDTVEITLQMVGIPGTMSEMIQQAHN